jgi:polar amino acid transport system substrate-binding protein
MKVIKPSKLISIAFVFLSQASWAGNFTVGVEATDYLPLYKGDTGNYTGYSRELLDAFAAKYGHTFTYKPFPIARLFDEFTVAKSIDFKFPDNPYWAANSKKGLKISYSQGLAAVTEGLLVSPSKRGQPAAAVTKIAAVRGFTPFPYLDAINSKKILVTEVNTPDAGISMVESGRVDGVYLGVLAATHIMENKMNKPGVVVFDSGLPNTVGDFSLSTITRPEVIEQMNEFLAKEKDLVAKLKAKYKIAP